MPPSASTRHADGCICCPIYGVSWHIPVSRPCGLPVGVVPQPPSILPVSQLAPRAIKRLACAPTAPVPQMSLLPGGNEDCDVDEYVDTGPAVSGTPSTQWLPGVNTQGYIGRGRVLGEQAQVILTNAVTRVDNAIREDQRTALAGLPVDHIDALTTVQLVRALIARLGGDLSSQRSSAVELVSTMACMPFTTASQPMNDTPPSDNLVVGSQTLCLVMSGCCHPFSELQCCK